jgi:peptide/nickel transport system ATP-binding protein
MLLRNRNRAATAPQPRRGGTLLEIEDLRVDIGTLPILKGIGLRLERGETLALAGESGSGKSMTAL